MAKAKKLPSGNYRVRAFVGLTDDGKSHTSHSQHRQRKKRNTLPQNSLQSASGLLIARPTEPFQKPMKDTLK